MANERIARKDLWKSGLNNVKQTDWIKAAQKLGLSVVHSNSGTSHTHTIRDPKNPDVDDIKSLITTLQVNLYKEANRGIFNDLLDFGIAEDDIWKALKKL